MDVKPSLALAIAFVFLAVGGAATWFTQQGLRTTGPGDIGIDTQGALYAHFGDRVFIFDSNTQPAGNVDLTSIGAVGLWGGLSFFPNGDWLIAPEGTEHDGRLHRCHAEGGLSCELLEELQHRFSRTFRAGVSNEEQFYLSESGTDTLSLRTARGARIATLDKTLDRPGEVKRYGNRLAVADVFGLRMLVLEIDPETGLWSEEIASFHTPTQGAPDIRYPVDFFLHEDMWYVLVKDVSMRNARLHRYTSHGEFIDELPLPKTDMVMAMEKHAGAVVLSDFRQARLLRIGLNGEPMDDLSSADWEHYRQLQKDMYKPALVMGISLWVLFAVLFLVGIFIALRQHLESSKTKRDRVLPPITPRTTPPEIFDPAIHWLQSSRARRLLPWIMGISLLGASASFLFLVSTREVTVDDELMNAITLMITGMIAIVLWYIHRKPWKTRLGVLNDWVIVQFPDGTVAKSRATDLQIAGALLFVDKKAIPLGSPDNRLFEQAEFTRYLDPLLAHAQRLQWRDAYRFRWQYARAGVVAEIVVAILAIAMLYSM